ncbi:MAG TPA: PAS domain S-box protein [Armatimonadota bacterium]|nr:PAS domain S-box protein [Armatimonadota bacterium]
MSKPSDQQDWDVLRQKILGMGEQSISKSYYPELQRRMAELEHTNRSLRILSAVNQTLVHAKTERELFEKTCNIAVTHGKYRMAWVGFVDEGTDKRVCPICTAGDEQDFLNTIHISCNENDVGYSPTRTAIQTGKPAIVPDIAAVPESERWRAEALKRGFRSLIVLPLIIEGDTTGAFGLFSADVGGFTQDEVQLLTELASDLSYGIMTLRTREKHQKAEEALRESERQYRLLAENSTDMISRHDPQGVYLYVSPACRGLLGYEPDELVGHTATEFIHPDDIAAIKQANSSVLKNEREISALRYRIRRKDNQYIWFETTSRALRDTAGTVIEIQSSSRDVTERVKADEGLKQSEQRLSAIIENAPYGAHEYELHADGRLVFIGCNQAADHILHTDCHRYMGKTIEEIFPRLRETALPDAYRTVAKTGQRYEDDQVTFAYDHVSGVFEISAFQTAPNRMAVFFRDITERKRAEDALQRERLFTDAVVDSVPGLLYLYDDQWHLVRWNKKHEEMTGYTAAELAHKSAFDWFEGPDRDRLARALEEMNQQGYSSVEGNLITRDGKAIPFYFTIVRLIIEDKPYFVGIGIDITERKRAEEAYQESEERLRTLINAMPDIVCFKDGQGRWLEANDFDLRLFQLEGVDYRGKTDSELAQYSEFYREAFMLCEDTDEQAWRAGELLCSANDEAAWKTGKISRNDEIIPRPDGTEKVFDIIKAPIFYPDGKRKGLIVVGRDITERRQAERAVKRERAFLASAIELLPFPIIFFTPSREVSRQNNAASSFLRASGGSEWWQITLRDPQTHLTIPPEKWPVAKALQGNTVPAEEFIMSLPNGRDIPVLMHMAPVLVNEKLDATVLAFQDITALKAADQAKNQFLMVLSHEIKTPLTSIIGWTQIAQHTPDVVQQALSIILRNANEQQRILERLLILSQILTGKLELRREPVELWQLVHEVILHMEEAAAEHHLSLVVHSPGELLPIEGDKQLLQQAVQEIVANAIQFTEPQGTVTITGQHIANVVRLTVTDTGRGFAAEQLSGMLKPFQQIQREEAVGGLGIGLSLAQGIVEAHGAQFQIFSAGLGHGTTVTLEFPYLEQLPTLQREHGDGQ